MSGYYNYNNYHSLYSATVAGTIGTLGTETTMAGTSSALNMVQTASMGASCTEADIGAYKNNIEKYLKDFSYGNISYNDFEAFMLGFGAENFEQIFLGDKVVQKFTLDGKKYEVICCKEAAQKSTDEIVDENGYYTKKRDLTDASGNKIGYCVEKFDAYGKKINSLNFDLDNNPTYTNEYVYDENGKLAFETTRKYNADGSVLQNLFTYDKNGNQIAKTVTIFDKTGNMTQEVVCTIKDGNAIPQTVKAYINGKINQENFYAYDENDKIVSETVKKHNADGSVLQDVYIYDKDGNQTGKTVTKFDIQGNITQEVICIIKNGKAIPQTVKAYVEGRLTQEIEYKYNKDGDLAGSILINYDEVTGKEKNAIVYTGDGVSKAPQSLYQYNNDGTVTYSIFKDDKWQNFVTFSEKEYSYDNPVVKTETKEINGLTHSIGYDAEGKTVFDEYNDKDGKLNVVHYFYKENGDKDVVKNVYDENGKIAKKHFDSYKNGKIVLGLVTGYDTQGNAVYEQTYKYKDGKVVNLVQINYDASQNVASRLIYGVDETNTIVKQSQYQYNSDGTVRYYVYDQGERYLFGTFKNNDLREENSVVKTEISTGSDGKKHKKEFDVNGNVVSEKIYNKNGKLEEIQINTYDENGNRTLFRSVYDEKGNVRNHVYSYEGDKIISEVIKRYNTNGDVESESVIEYKDGKYYRKTDTYYDVSSHTKTSEKVYVYDKDKNDWVLKSDDSQTKSTKNSTNTKNNESTGRNDIIGLKVSAHGITITQQAMYDAITSDLDLKLTKNGKDAVKLLGVEQTTRDVLHLMGGMKYGADENYTASFLEAAQANSDTKPLGCDGTEYHYGEEGEYSEIIRQILENSVGKSYGLNPSDIIGYHWNSDSDICTRMVNVNLNRRTLYTYLREVLSAIANGEDLPNTTIDFEKDDDLHYSLHSVRVLGYELSGTKLKLTLFDVYDFNLEDKGKNNSFNSVGAAAMQDGKLVPYYEIFELEIS